MKSFTIILTSLIFFSCSKSKIKTILDFELGMTHDDYKKHAYKLENSNIISFRLGVNGEVRWGNIDNQIINYTVVVDDSLRVLTEIRGFLGGIDNENSKMTQIDMLFRYPISDYEKRKFYNMMEAKYGKPEVPFYKNQEYQLWYATWNKQNMVIRMILGDYDNPAMIIPQQAYGVVTYEARGNFLKKIDKENNDNSGKIKVDNKF